MTAAPVRSTPPPLPVPPFFDSDLCVKCNICTAACPVAGVTTLFPGPKAVGPQMGRFWQPAAHVVDPASVWCSGCGVCSRVCPQGVPVAEMNIISKAEVQPGPRLRLRDWAIARPAEVARWMRPGRRFAEFAFHSRPARRLAERLIGLARRAPLPVPAAVPLSRRRPELLRRRPTPVSTGSRPRVAFFHGCSTEGYEPWLGEMTIRVLAELGVDVEIPPQVCCGLPLQSNHSFDAARRRARRNLEGLRPWVEQGIHVVGTSTSCTLALKHEYRAVLGLVGPDADATSEVTYDLFEYLAHILSPDLSNLRPVPLRVLYHPPCQLRSHRIGSPALQILRAIPDLTLEVSQSECCGVAGTYGLKAERYQVARDVGAGLFDQIRISGVDRVLTDSETCRWWIEGHSRVPAIHPVELLSAALGLPDLRPRETAVP